MAEGQGKQEPSTPWERCEAKMRRLGISPEALEERFVLGSGKGGQKVNKTASTVQVRDPRSGIEVKCQSERSQYLNRLRARERLCELLEEERDQKRQARMKLLAKNRFAKRKPSKRQKTLRVAAKRKRGAAKQNRSKPGPSD